MTNRTYEKRRSAGLCAECGRVSCHTYRCPSCQCKLNQRVLAMRHKRKRIGQCMFCKRPALEGLVRCVECKKRAALRDAAPHLREDRHSPKTGVCGGR